MQMQSDLHRQHATIHGQLRRGQVASLATLGVALWLLFALLIRYSIPAGLFGSTAASALLFAAAIPGAWLLVQLCRRTAPLTPEQSGPGVAGAASAALPCDGVALTWAQSLYGDDPTSVLLAAAWLLWGVGACLAVALLVARRKAS